MQNKQEKGCFYIGMGIFGLFFLIGAAVLYYGVIATKAAIQDAQHWVETPCEILDSEVSRHQIKDGTSKPHITYAINIHFQYKFGEQVYVSDRYDFYIFEGEEEWVRSTVASLPAGTKTQCYVNPDDPTEAVLSREKRSESFVLFSIMPISMLVIGTLGMGFIFIVYAPISPLAWFTDKMFSLADKFVAVPDERVRELLSDYGELQPQELSDWQGEYPLPQNIASFYKDIGPVNLTIDGHPAPAFFPSLSNLADLQAKFYEKQPNHGSWMKMIRTQYDHEPGGWIVVAVQGTNPYIYSTLNAAIYYAKQTDDSWGSELIFTNFNSMAAVIATLGTIARPAGTDITDHTSQVRPRYCNQAFAELTESLCSKSEATDILTTLGWGNPTDASS